MGKYNYGLVAVSVIIAILHQVLAPPSAQYTDLQEDIARENLKTKI